MAIELDDGTIVRSLPEQVDFLTTANEENEIAIDNLTARLEAAISGVLHYKGSVPTYADLPADAEIGDVYNVIDTGANYAWTGSEWDELGMTVDLSNYVTLDGIQTITGKKIIESGQINSVTGNFVPDTTGKALGSDTTHWSFAYIQQVFHLRSVSVPQNQNLYISFGGIPSKGLFLNESEIWPFNTNHNLGTASNLFGNIYFGGSLRDGNNANYGYTLPNSTSLTANSELLDTASVQTIAGVKTFSSGIGLGNNSLIYLDANNDVRINPNGYSLKIMGKVIPHIVNALDLGTSALKWKDLYLSGTANAGTLKASIIEPAENSNNKFSFNESSFTWSVNANFAPQGDNARDLGKNNVRWKDLHLSGVLTDDTNSVNIADLKALIDYAKAQGWIS